MVDQANITVPAPGSVTGAQDATILIDGLFAELVDNVTENGPEFISATIAGVPDGTDFSSGSPIANNTWIIPVADLPTLSITPPQYFAGVMNLTLTAFTFESSTGEETNISASFDVQIGAIPDSFLILAFDVDFLNSTGFADSRLAIRLNDGRLNIEPGEIPNEYVEVNYTGLPTGVRLVPEAGGRLIDLGGGSFTFIGTEDQANSLRLSTGPSTPDQVSNIQVSVVSIDDGQRLPTPITDTFRLSVDADTDSVLLSSGPAILNGTVLGNDVLQGNNENNTLIGNGGNDLLIGGEGFDVMEGGDGADMFKWESAAEFGGSAVDIIEDFDADEGDIINISEVLNGLIEYNPQNFFIGDFLTVTNDGMGNFDVAFGPNVTGLENQVFVTLNSPTGVVSAQDLFDKGSILL